MVFPDFFCFLCFSEESPVFPKSNFSSPRTTRIIRRLTKTLGKLASPEPIWRNMSGRTRKSRGPITDTKEATRSRKVTPSVFFAGRKFSSFALFRLAGYHSYVSTSELAIASYSDKPARETDRRRRDRWEEQGSAGRDSVVTTSSGSAGSTETLKWHGSMSDVSVGGSSRRSLKLFRDIRTC